MRVYARFYAVSNKTSGTVLSFRASAKRETWGPLQWRLLAGTTAYRYAQRFARSTALLHPAISEAARSRDIAGSKRLSTCQLAATSASSRQ